MAYWLRHFRSKKCNTPLTHKNSGDGSFGVLARDKAFSLCQRAVPVLLMRRLIWCASASKSRAFPRLPYLHRYFFHSICARALCSVFQSYPPAASVHPKSVPLKIAARFIFWFPDRKSLPARRSIFIFIVIRESERKKYSASVCTAETRPQRRGERIDSERRGEQ
jgi:hypothetical protein